MAVGQTLTFLSLVLSALSNPLSTYSDGTIQRQYPYSLAPLISPNVPPQEINKDTYIVVMKPEVQETQFIQHVDAVHLSFLKTEGGDSLLAKDGGLKHVYNMEHFKGYAGSFEEDTINILRSQPEVDYVEKSQMFYANEASVQKNAPWGLARISHRDKLTLSTFRRYEYESEGGDGVDVYVIDTGIQIHHEEFEGRASWGLTVNKQNPDLDDNGHGTHCAGTIASRAYGVAKKANVIAVKVLGGSGGGSTEDVVAGIQYAATDAGKKKLAAQAELKKTGKTKYKGSVANMSLGGGKSNALDRAVNAAVKSGIHFAVAAGNENRDACQGSPAGAEEPITVGASTNGDERAYFSNYGPCVDIFGPGLNIKSTWNGPRNDSTNTISGTSMATPHTVGLIAYLLSLYPSATFNPPLPKKVSSSIPMFESYNSLVTLARETLPGWMTVLLPITQNIAPVPVPGPDAITPAIMKKALIKLSTPGALVDLPADTVNYLIYNNASALGLSFWETVF